MTTARPTIGEEIERYLFTGESDPTYSAWPGGFLERANRGREELRGALVGAVCRARASGQDLFPPNTDTVALTRPKIEPMVRGLFPRAERDAVLGALQQSVIFVSAANIERILHECSFNSTAWTLANLYLASLGEDLLGKDAPRLVGFSEETICYVSPEYFTESDPFADFIVHEVAHVFHNCKRATIGIRETRTKQWLLDIDFKKRETFAYACEAYARVCERAGRPVERLRLAEEFSREVGIPDDRVDAAEVASLVRAAAAASNGWKVILAGCAPSNSARKAIGRPEA